MSGVHFRLRALVLLWWVPAIAYAYVDPGSGMLIYQGLVAAIGVAIAVVRHPVEAVKRVVAFFASKLRR
jgi:hypothetical protein